MKIMHIITTSADNRSAVESMGFKPTDGIVAMFEVAEDDERWPQVARRVKEWGASHVQPCP